MKNMEHISEEVQRSGSSLWSRLDCVLPAYTVFVPVIAYLLSVIGFLVRPGMYDLESPFLTYAISTGVLTVLWLGTRKGNLAAFALHAILGTWILCSKPTFGLFTTEIIVRKDSFSKVGIT